MKDLSSFLQQIDPEHTEQDFQIMMQLLDKKSHDTVSFDEFMKLVTSDSRFLDQELMEAFKIFDLDGDGYISLNEAILGFKHIGEDMTQ